MHRLQNLTGAARTPVSQLTGRFAPSPSGPLHFGSLVAALGSFLAARSQGGRWLVRIEDLDPPRVQAGAISSILRSLDAHGLHWDGEILYQSQRFPAYQAALEQLQQAKLVYPCSCTRKELAVCSPTTIYPGLCRHRPRHPQRPCALRLRVIDGIWHFNDAIYGYYQQNLLKEVGDFVLKRSDGLFAYQLAVVVDDAYQGVTQVVRGADLLDSTPRQLWLHDCLRLPHPHYAHLPLALSSNGEKLGKSTHAPALDEQYTRLNLLKALRFLQQPLMEATELDSVEELLASAIAHWRWPSPNSTVTQSPHTAD